MNGETLGGKYKVVRLLGEGGMGSVYEAEQLETGLRVAVKVINERLLTKDTKALRRFRREARTAGAIGSQHIVQVLDAGADEATGLSYLVMELLSGEDLQQAINRVGPLAPDLAIRITAQALQGLMRAHEAGVVHRDIKPANLFLARSQY